MLGRITAWLDQKRQARLEQEADYYQVIAQDCYSYAQEVGSWQEDSLAEFFNDLGQAYSTKAGQVVISPSSQPPDTAVSVKEAWAVWKDLSEV